MTTATGDIELIEDDDTLVEEGSNEFLEMSDEEFLALDFATTNPVVAPVVEAAAAVETPPVVTPVAANTPVAAPAVEAPPAEGAAPVVEPPAAVNYQEAYEKLTAPFRANGKDMQVENVDEAIRLMQLGANYNKKMAALKPGLKALKMLENNGLLDEGKLSFLIDVNKKDPAAITRLLKDSGLDPLNLDLEKADDYRASSYTVADVELDLDSVLEELKDSPTYTKTLDLVSTKWDAISRKTVANTPQLLKVIDGHMATGVYPLISTALEKQRMLGTLNGLTDIEAYQKVGDELHAKGAFNHLFQPKVEKPAAIVVTATPKAADTGLNDRRRAAAPTRSMSVVKTDDQFNPLAMSDEEFSKTMGNQF